MNDSQRQCILVLGMHRSGTSAFSRLFNFAGADLPANLVGAIKGNELGHWESKAVALLNERTLSALDRSWCDWRRLDWSIAGPELPESYDADFIKVVASEYGGAEFFVLKEPRLCRFADRVIPAMKQAGLDVHVIIPVRNPIEVCSSLARRDSMNWADAAILWLRHTLEGERASRSRPRAVVFYDRLLTDWQREFTRLTTHAEIVWPRSIEDIAVQVQGFLDAGQRHHAANNDELLTNVLTKGWLRRTLQAMERLTTDPKCGHAISDLDRIAMELDSADPFLENLHDRLPANSKGLQALSKTKRPVAQRVRAELQRWRKRSGLS